MDHWLPSPTHHTSRTQHQELSTQGALVITKLLHIYNMWGFFRNYQNREKLPIIKVTPILNTSCLDTQFESALTTHESLAVSPHRTWIFQYAVTCCGMQSFSLMPHNQAMHSLDRRLKVEDSLYNVQHRHCLVLLSGYDSFALLYSLSFGSVSKLQLQILSTLPAAATTTPTADTL